MPSSLETTRLTLEPWSAGDAGLLRRLATTPAVVRWIGDGLPWSDARCHTVAAAIEQHWREHGFGWRIARERATGAPVGLIALGHAGEGAGVDPLEYEIGWWLDPAAWGRGLAREGAAAVRDEAFARVGAPSILARIQPANAASMAVAGAIGLQYESETRGRGGELAAVLRLTEATWRAELAKKANA